MKADWLNEKESFDVRDVRELKGNFLPGLLKKAKNMEAGEGLCVVQSFEPIPLYSALEELGFEHHTEQVSESEYRIFFYRTDVHSPTYPEGLDIPLKPTAIVNINAIEPKLANVVVPFWELIWGQENSAIDMKTRLLLSLANGVGAGRMRQAVRELVKAYSVGATVAEFDELFSMLVWNQGIGYFASEIGPSALFAAYQFIKTQEGKGVARSEIVKGLMARFGEKNPEVGAFYKMTKDESPSGESND
jgi:alkylhydroperoxidase/carboxymuconolactone decarboxylase family protein YurZ